MTRSPFLASALAGATLLAAAGSLAAHDFWIVPNAFEVAPNGELEVRGQTSSLFPTSEAAVAPERVADARLISAHGAEPLRDLSVSGKSLLIRHRPSAAGQHVVAVALLPRLVRESPASFRRYMLLEGAPEALARYEREGRLPAMESRDSITRRYAKYAKTIVGVGRGGARAFDRAAGHPLEFVPLRDPALLRAGDTLAVRVVMLGRPLAGAHVHAGAVTWAGTSTLTDTTAARRSAAGDVSLTTDAHGVIRVALARGGLWNVRAIQIVPATRGSGADWDVHWATLVFRVGDGDAAAAHDSAVVAAVVRRYGAALEAGDSAAVLTLLAPDAVILESGGIETREEYRNHHLASDIAFARAVRREESPIQVKVGGDVAWAWSTSVSHGDYRGRPVNSNEAELMVLARGADGGWLIQAIHWSSRTRRQP